MLLTILGCSGSLPGPNAPASGYLVEAEGFRLLIDLGNGALGALQSRCDPFSVNAVVLSHLHPDHCADFSALTVLRRYHPAPPYDPRELRLPVFAPEEAPTRLAAAYAPSEEERVAADLSDVYEFHALAEGTIHIGPFEVTAARVAHPCTAFGFRVSHAGQDLVYTGDSGPCEALTRLADGANLLLSEASWPHSPANPVDVHMSGREAGELARAAGVRQLLLTHVPPWTDRRTMLREARAVFAGPIQLAEQGVTYPIGPQNGSAATRRHAALPNRR
ncbi:MBL fold metallo-hydrolase [Allokutzneria albata]|uniref:Ribonuclease BN, tRNA processing enzyme n=1 Tax=Allokutzneria albata TaxID=211114 RepID=A0A1G9XV73_ALLAB|nr:MBL fold metallo-hydrolase [Allokutzneria albata]SDN00729.1 Ribonuclease BN, tRNA processing enzyme [Allokutzneria albata]